MRLSPISYQSQIYSACTQPKSVRNNISMCGNSVKTVAEVEKLIDSVVERVNFADFPKTLGDVYCPSRVKEDLRKAIVYPLGNNVRSLAIKNHVPVISDGVFLYGPNVNKNLIAGAVANEANIPAYIVGPEQFEKLDLFNMGEYFINRLFNRLSSPLEYKPGTYFKTPMNYKMLIIKDVDKLFDVNTPIGRLQMEQLTTKLSNCAERQGIIPVLTADSKDMVPQILIRKERAGNWIEVP